MIQNINSIVIIGSGNVAFQLAQQWASQDIIIKQVYSRNIATGKALAELLNCSFINSIESLDNTADLYLLAVNDDNIVDITHSFPFHLAQTQIIAHTSGATPAAFISSTHSNYGCIWPILSINKQEHYDWSGVPFAIIGANGNTINSLQQLMNKLSNSVFLLNDEDKTKLHLSATIVNNFSNHLYALTEKYCNKNDIDFKMLVPMLTQQVAKLDHISPTLTQTGPAARHDHHTIAKHLALLKNEGDLVELYELITAQIINKSK